MYITPYYDLAKLSHCIHGKYDAILHGSKVNFNKQRKHFNRWLLSSDMDVEFVRLIESSLFLSLLPLHMDRIDVHHKFIQSAVAAYKATT